MLKAWTFQGDNLECKKATNRRPIWEKKSQLRLKLPIGNPFSHTAFRLGTIVNTGDEEQHIGALKGMVHINTILVPIDKGLITPRVYGFF